MNSVSFNPVIWGFFGYDYVMNVTFLESGGCDFNESCFFTKFGNRGASDIPHSRLKSSHELENTGAKRPTERHPALDSFGDRFQTAFDIILTISVPASELHCLQATHAAVNLITSPLIEYRFPGTFLCPGKKTADHNAAGAGSQGFFYISGIFNASIGHYRNIMLFRCLAS